MQTAYFDHAATTPPDPQVIRSMQPYLTEEYGNASSIHHMGRKPNVAVEQSRAEIAGYLGADPAEIIFTSGGTESNNAALFGVLQNRRGREIVSAETEHSAVRYPLEQAGKNGYVIRYAPLDRFGRVQPESLEELLGEQTAMVCLMHANNETGILHPVASLSALCRKHGIPFHCDTVQSVGKIPVDVNELGVDFLTLSAHKLYGPKGVGALYVRAGTPWSGWMQGGAQERGRRGGTLNVPGIAGMAKSMEIAHRNMEQENRHIAAIRRQFVDGIREKLGDQVRFNSEPGPALEHIVSITLTDPHGSPLDGEMLLLNLDMEGICCSNGSACTSGTVTPSHVMLALGYSEEMARSTLRFSFGRTNTPEQTKRAVDVLAQIVERHSVSSV